MPASFWAPTRHARTPGEARNRSISESLFSLTLPYLVAPGVLSRDHVADVRVVARPVTGTFTVEV